MKKRMLYLVFALLIVIIAIISILSDSKSKKEVIFDYVVENEEMILSAVEEISYLSQYIPLDFKEEIVAVDNPAIKEDADDVEGLCVTIEGLLGSRIEKLDNEHIQKIINSNPVDGVGIDKGIIIFGCGGRGIAPSSQYYYFYYSAEDKPVAVFDNRVICEPSQMAKENNGYKYIDSGHNIFSVEKIKDKFYFCEASF